MTDTTKTARRKTYPQASGFALKEGRLRLGKVGLVPVRQHRPLEGTPKTCTVRRSATGKWYATAFLNPFTTQLGRSFGKSCPAKRKKLVGYWWPSTRPIPRKIILNADIDSVRHSVSGDISVHAVVSTLTEMKTPLVTS